MKAKAQAEARARADAAASFQREALTAARAEEAAKATAAVLAARREVAQTVRQLLDISNRMMFLGDIQSGCSGAGSERCRGCARGGRSAPA